MAQYRRPHDRGNALMAIKGSLKEASLPDVLQLLSMGKKTGCLGLSFHDSFGSIYFDNGRICHAAIVNRPLDTENAVYTLFTWTSGTFNFEQGVEPEDGAERVSVDPQSLLLEGARRVDEWSLIEKKIPSFDVVFSLDRPRLMMNRDPLSPEPKLSWKESPRQPVFLPMESSWRTSGRLASLRLPFIAI